METCTDPSRGTFGRMNFIPPGTCGVRENVQGEGGGSKNEVCFIHSTRLLTTADSNPRYTGRVRVFLWQHREEECLSLRATPAQAELVYSLIEAYGLLDHMR